MPKTPIPIRAHLRFYLSVVVLITCFMIGGLATTGPALAWQQSLVPSSSHRNDHQFLILKTGSVYEGQLEFTADKYIVRLPTGASIKFHSGEVDFIASSMDEAYLRMSRRLRSDDLIGQQWLTNWTLKYQQLDRAAEQVGKLKSLAANSAMTRLAQRQLDSLRGIADREKRGERQLDTTATAIKEIPKANTNLASHSQLAKTVASFDEASLRVFSRDIHPKIVHGCAAAKCHGNADTGMRLWRVENRGGINSTGVRRNLHAIAQFLDRDKPADSKLLHFVSTVHGDLETPAYDKNSFQYYAIQEWVMRVGNSNSLVSNDNASVAQASYVNGSSTEPLGNEDGAISPDPAAVDSKEWPTLPGFESDLPAPVNLNQQTPKFVPRDEFDPEIFNRKFGMGAKQAKASNSVLTKMPRPEPPGQVKPIRHLVPKQLGNGEDSRLPESMSLKPNVESKKVDPMKRIRSLPPTNGKR